MRPINESRLARTGLVSPLNEGLIVNVKLFKMNIKFLVDTGSDVTFINSEIYKKIPELVRPDLNSQTDINVKLADGSPLNIEGETKVYMEINNRHFYQTVFVAAIDIDGIIGNDFLRMHQCKVDYRTNELRFCETDCVTEKRSARQTVHCGKISVKQKNTDSLPRRQCVETSSKSCERAESKEITLNSDTPKDYFRRICGKPTGKGYLNSMCHYMFSGLNKIFSWCLLLAMLLGCVHTTTSNVKVIPNQVSYINNEHFKITAVENQVIRCCALNNNSSARLYEMWTHEDIHDAQMSNPDVRNIIHWKIPGDGGPTWSELSALNPVVKTYWAQWDVLTVCEGVLCRKMGNTDGKNSYMYGCTGTTPN